MSNAELIRIADDAVSMIDGKTFSQTIEETKRVYVPRMTKESLAQLRLNVVPIVEAGTRAGRKLFTYIYTIQIGISKRLDSAEPEHVDPMAFFSQEVADFFRNARFPTAQVMENGVELALFDQENLRDTNVYMSLITLQLEGSRDV